MITSMIPLEQQFLIDERCRAQGVSFMSSFAWGVFGGVFCDLGDSWRVEDATGDQPQSFQVASITKEIEPLVMVREESLGWVSTGDKFVFDDVDGMDQLNDGVPR